MTRRGLAWPGCRDADHRRPVERAAVRIQRRAENRRIAGAARPGGVAAAVAEAGLVADEHLAGAEGVGRAGSAWVAA
jgi:hypothetical protein